MIEIVRQRLWRSLAQSRNCGSRIKVKPSNAGWVRVPPEAQKKPCKLLIFKHFTRSFFLNPPFLTKTRDYSVRFVQEPGVIYRLISNLRTLIGRSEPARDSSTQVSPVGTKPHFSITRPLAGLSMKWMLISEGMSVVRRILSIISRRASVQMPRFQ